MKNMLHDNKNSSLLLGVSVQHLKTKFKYKTEIYIYNNYLGQSEV